MHYIHGSSQGQFIMETYIVMLLNAAVVVGFIMLNEAHTMKGDPGKKRVLSLVVSAVSPFSSPCCSQFSDQNIKAIHTVSCSSRQGAKDLDRNSVWCTLYLLFLFVLGYILDFFQFRVTFWLFWLTSWTFFVCKSLLFHSPLQNHHCC